MEEIETVFGVGLPPSYRTFLLECNGGFFSQEVVYFEEGDEDDEAKWCFIDQLYGVATEQIVDAERGLVFHLNVLRDRIPKEFIPIGRHHGGDQICLGVVDPYVGMIWSWYHEGDEIGPLANMSFVCSTFDRFLEGLRFVPDMEHEEALPVFQAIERADVERLRSLIAEERDLEVRNAKGLTPLQFAASIGQSNVVDLLIKQGSQLDARDEEGNTPLSLAATSGSVDIVQKLLRAGAEVDSRNHLGHTPLMNAAWFGSTRVIKRLIDAGADINATRYDGLSPLMMCFHNELNRRVLLEAGAKVPLGPIREFDVPDRVPDEWSRTEIFNAIDEFAPRSINTRDRMLELGNRQGHGDKLQLELNYLQKLRIRLKELP